MTVVAGSTITLHDGSGFSWDGYFLDGWYTNIAGTTTNYDVGARYTVTSDVTFYARWVLARTVTYNLNGGYGATPETLTVKNGTDITLPYDNFSREVFTFGGWTKTLNYVTETYSGDSSFNVTGNVTLIAVWTFSARYSEQGIEPTSYLLYLYYDFPTDGTYVVTTSLFSRNDICSYYYRKQSSIL